MNLVPNFPKHLTHFSLGKVALFSCNVRSHDRFFLFVFARQKPLASFLPSVLLSCVPVFCHLCLGLSFSSHLPTAFCHTNDAHRYSSPLPCREFAVFQLARVLPLFFPNSFNKEQPRSTRTQTGPLHPPTQQQQPSPLPPSIPPPWRKLPNKPKHARRGSSRPPSQPQRFCLR